jgi:hypothetical protein
MVSKAAMFFFMSVVEKPAVQCKNLCSDGADYIYCLKLISWDVTHCTRSLVIKQLSMFRIYVLAPSSLFYRVASVNPNHFYFLQTT